MFWWLLLYYNHPPCSLSLSSIKTLKLNQHSNDAANMNTSCFPTCECINCIIDCHTSLTWALSTEQSWSQAGDQPSGPGQLILVIVTLLMPRPAHKMWAPMHRDLIQNKNGSDRAEVPGPFTGLSRPWQGWDWLSSSLISVTRVTQCHVMMPATYVCCFPLCHHWCDKRHWQCCQTASAVTLTRLT